MPRVARRLCFSISSCPSGFLAVRIVLWHIVLPRVRAGAATDYRLLRTQVQQLAEHGFPLFSLRIAQQRLDLGLLLLADLDRLSLDLFGVASALSLLVQGLASLLSFLHDALQEPSLLFAGELEFRRDFGIGQREQPFL